MKVSYSLLPFVERISNDLSQPDSYSDWGYSDIPL